MGSAQESLFWIGLKNTGRGLLRRVPLFAAALLAMIILTSLDTAKTNYEIGGGSGNRSFEINDAFVTKLDPKETWSVGVNNREAVDSTLAEWLNESDRFMYHTFSNRRALLDALAARARLAKEKRQAALEQEKEKIQETKATLNQELENAKRRKRRARRSDLAEIEEKLEAQRKREAEIDPEIVRLDAPLKTTTRTIYTQFNNQLPQILLSLQKRPLDLRDTLLKPILNEQSSLSVVYHVFRMTALIVVILSFVFILVMLVQQSPFAGETDTVSGQLRTLISMKSAGVGGEIAKTAIISVTALGVGTAVFVGARGPDLLADSDSVVNRRPAVMDTARPWNVLFGGPGSGTSSDPVAEEYYLQTLFSEKNRFSYFYDQRQFGNGPQTPTNNFNPTILPAPVEVHILPGANITALVDELKKLVVNVNSALDLQVIKDRITILEAQVKLLNTPGCQCATALADIVKKLEDLNKAIGTTPSPSPSPSPTASPGVPTTTLTPTPTPTPTPPSILSTLGEIDKDLKAIRADNLIELNSSSKNLGTSVKQLLGSEYYLVSEQAEVALKVLLTGHPQATALTEVLAEMKKKSPEKKGTFLKEFRGVYRMKLKASQMSEEDINQKIGELKPWEKTILNYARLQR